MVKFDVGTHGQGSSYEIDKVLALIETACTLLGHLIQVKGHLGLRGQGRLVGDRRRGIKRVPFLLHSHADRRLVFNDMPTGSTDGDRVGVAAGNGLAAGVVDTLLPYGIGNISAAFIAGRQIRKVGVVVEFCSGQGEDVLVLNRRGRGLAIDGLGLVQLHLYAVNLVGPFLLAIPSPCGDYGDGRLFSLVGDGHRIIGGSQVCGVVWNIRRGAHAVLREPEVNLQGIGGQDMTRGRAGLHGIVERTGRITGPFVALSDGDESISFICDIFFDLYVAFACDLIGGKCCPAEHVARLRVQLGDGQLVVYIFVVKDDAEAESLLIGIDFKLRAAPVDQFAVLIVSDGRAGIPLHGAVDAQGRHIRAALDNLIV